MLAISLWHVADAAYLHAKAGLGQILLHRAWNETGRTGIAAKPWPWADTHPVARLVIADLDVDLLVLEGANGRTLAWGPGHAERSAIPGSRGHAVVTGHRDTHFAFLQKLERNQRIVVTTANRTTRAYRVERAFVTDHRSLSLPADEDATTLSLVTCFPFDGVNPNTPLRYAVIARAE
ncbi:MAG TPA: class GN sortase [Casimicrobiaceae bacterium]|nr:class GN sortase [Casimicrobiaceae bacterium]